MARIHGFALLGLAYLGLLAYIWFDAISNGWGCSNQRLRNSAATAATKRATQSQRSHEGVGFKK